MFLRGRGGLEDPLEQGGERLASVSVPECHLHDGAVGRLGLPRMGRAGSPSDGRRVDVPVVSETARSSGLRPRARQRPRPGGGWQRRGRRRPVGWWERPLPAGRVSEDGKGVVSHEVPPASSSSEGRQPGAEGFVQSSRRPGKVRLRTVDCRGQSEQQVVSDSTRRSPSVRVTQVGG